MSNGRKIRNQDGIYFLTFQIINWIDLFTRQRYRDVFLDSLRYCQKQKNLEVHAYVVMSNHIHCILSSHDFNLSKTIGELKSFTSKSIIESIKEGPESRREWILGQFRYFAKKHKRNSEYQMWTHDNYPVELESNKFMDQKLNYIHENPVRAGIVLKPEDYLYSSARNYADLKGLIDVVYLE